MRDLLELRARRLDNGPVQAADLATFTRITTHNRMELLLDRQYYDKLFPALWGAKDSIHIAVLTLDDSPIGRAIADLLVEKKTANPDLVVRVIADNFGSRAVTPWSRQVALVRRMRAAGVEVKVNDLLRTGLEHRKVVVVDGHTGFFGGTCLGKEYYGSRAYWERFATLAKQEPGASPGVFRRKYDPSCRPTSELAKLDDVPDMPEFHDFTMACSGEIVRDLQVSFLQTWLLQGQQLDPHLDDREVRQRYFPQTPPVGDLPVKLVHSVPGGPSEMGRTLFEVIEAAQHTLDITFAYVLVPQFVDALCAAAKRGVKIRLLVPGEHHIDVPSAFFAFRANYPQLMEAGVALYEFKQYTHIKLMVADQRLVFASTGNPEWDSWDRGFDETALIDSPAMAAEVACRVFNTDLSTKWAVPVTPQSYAQMTTWQRTKMHVCRWLFDTFFSVRSPNPGTAAI